MIEKIIFKKGKVQQPITNNNVFDSSEIIKKKLTEDFRLKLVDIFTRQYNQ